MLQVPGAGIDVISIARIGKLSEAALRRVFTPAELEYCQRAPQRRLERLGARFAAKEAVLKCLGTGLSGGIRWQDVEILVDADTGAPRVHLSGVAGIRHQKLGGGPLAISLSHDGGVAMAVAVLR